MNRHSERGVALILTMILILVMSVMAVSLTFISRSETWSTMNYRLMSQARDAAEGGVNNTANYLMGATFSPLPTTYYTAPAYSGNPAAPFTGYNTAVSPVQSGTNTTLHDIILSASSTAQNYPDSTVQSTFNATGVGKGNFSAGNTTVNYATSAKLLQMQNLGPAPPFTSTNSTIQTWEITSQGTIAGVQGATEQVTAILERNISPVFGYAAFADATGCGALSFGGGGTTNSYADNGAMSGGAPVTANSDGNVGTNGNLSAVGNSTVINGNLSTPRIGVGNCSANNVTAATFNAQGNQLNGSMVELPQTVIYPTPTIPAACTLAACDLSSNGNCGSVTGCFPQGNNLHLLPTATNSIHDLSLTGNKDLYLSGGTYNINSITEQGSTALQLETVATCNAITNPDPVVQASLRAACVPVDATHPVILQVTGKTATGTTMATPIDLTGGSVYNPSTTFDPTTLEILYAGTGTVKLKGGGNATGMLYAPNATLTFGGGGDWYGSVICSTLTDMGGASIHYDRKLKDKYYIPGPYTVSSFTWNKY